MKYDWMLVMGSVLMPVAKGSRRCSTPARLARWLRKHHMYRGKHPDAVTLYYRPLNWRGEPMKSWRTRPYKANA